MLRFVSIAATIFGVVSYLKVVRLEERLTTKSFMVENRDEKISKLEKELSVLEGLSKEKDGLIKKLEEENFRLKRGW